MIQALKFRGRIFDSNELKVIEQVTKESYAEGRSAISRQICENINWRQPNGWLKDRACRDVLLHLDHEGIIKLPPPKIERTRISSKEVGNIIEGQRFSNMPLIEYYFRPQIKMVKGTADEKIWNELVKVFHYQSYSVIVGNNIKYMAFYDDIPVACIGWGSAAWSVEVRDKWLQDNLGWTRKDVISNLPKIINNVRFLILPWVKVRNLASTILSMMEKVVKNDWYSYYNIQPILLETFVEQARFYGTCYKAANWTYVGVTKGNAKKGNSWTTHNNIKEVFLRPLV